MSILNSLTKLMKFRSDRRGVTALEYGLLAALIGLVVAGGATTLGTSISGKFTAIGTAITGVPTTVATK